MSFPRAPTNLEDVRYGPDRVILNLGCGTRTSPHTVNIDWSLYLRLHRNPVLSSVAPYLMSASRRQRFLAMRGDVIVHDLRRGIPAANGTADAVYHSHVLEHLPRANVHSFFIEVRRVLKPGGIHRVVVPDLEVRARVYLASLEMGLPDHEQAIAAMIEQMVRSEAAGTSMQRPVRRKLENLLLGDARQRGENHLWMWDRLNLSNALSGAGFAQVQPESYDTSQIPRWNEIGLDLSMDGTGAHKPDSLYVEAAAPR